MSLRAAVVAFVLLGVAGSRAFAQCGYGTCQNGRDGNLTDTVFLDTDVPAAAQEYFYLVAYKSGGVQKGLGANSFGTARTVAAPCP